MPNRRELLQALASVALPAIAAVSARAEGPWPSRPITVVVPFAAGGAGNGSVRILAEVIGPRIGQPFVVDNRPGAGGIPGTQSVTSSSDDHTLLMGSTSMTILPALRKDLPYDVQRDLQPVGMISAQPLVLAVATDSPLKSLADLVAQGRGGQLTAGNSGVGTLSHLATELINRRLGTRLLAVPYKGDSVLIPDVVSGTISIGVMNLPVALPLIRGGRLRALAVTSAKPDPNLPGVPLLASLGEDFVISGWAALFAARRVPAAGIERLSPLLGAALAETSVRERFAVFGVEAQASTPAELAAYVKQESARWGEVVRDSGIKLE